MTVNVLGTEYSITKKKYADDEVFERRCIDGYCDGYTKEIVICDMATYKGWEHESPKTIAACEKQTLRHEIVHAFFHESGLFGCEMTYGDGWTKNEEMVDWIANQGIKIYEAWKNADAV